MSWRPSGWAKIRSIWLEQNFTTNKMRQKTFEAGADAMLEGLVVWGNEHCPHFEHLGESIAFKKHSCPYCWEALLGEVEDEV